MVLKKIDTLEMVKLGQQIASYKYSRGLINEELSKEFGCSKHLISKIMCRNYYPGPALLWRIKNIILADDTSREHNKVINKAKNKKDKEPCVNNKKVPKVAVKVKLNDKVRPQVTEKHKKSLTKSSRYAEAFPEFN